MLTQTGVSAQSRDTGYPFKSMLISNKSLTCHNHSKIAAVVHSFNVWLIDEQTLMALVCMGYVSCCVVSMSYMEH